MTIEEIIESPEKLHDQISTNVKRLRKENNISQLDLAHEIGLSGNAYITRAEKRTNGHHFNVEHLVKIAKVLNVDIQDLFDGII